MLTFLVVSSLALGAAVIAGVAALPILAVGAVIWLVLLPFRLLFKLVFGVLGAAFGLLAAPLFVLVAGLALAGVVVTGTLALLAPLVPIALLALLVWGIYRIAVPRAA
jgi:hypothetical protein